MQIFLNIIYIIYRNWITNNLVKNLGYHAIANSLPIIIVRPESQG